MGLDMHLFAISKLTDNELKKYHNHPIELLDDTNISVIRKETIEDEEEAMIEGIKSCLSEATVIDSLIDIKKIKIDNDIPDDAYISGQCYSFEFTEYIFRNDKGFRKEVKLPNDELYDKYVIHPESDVYLFHKHEVHYWRKYYNLQNLIHEMIEEDNNTDVMNCGYYPLTDEQIEQINDFLAQHPYEDGTHDEVFDRNTEDETIVYWEWY